MYKMIILSVTAICQFSNINYKDSLCPEFLTNLGAKGAKRSVKMRAIKFYKNYFQKYFVLHEQQAVKISFIMYILILYTGCFILNGIKLF